MSQNYDPQGSGSDLRFRFSQGAEPGPYLGVRSSQIHEPKPEPWVRFGSKPGPKGLRTGPQPVYATVQDPLRGARKLLSQESENVWRDNESRNCVEDKRSLHEFKELSEGQGVHPKDSGTMIG